jgi:hypothetical protein
VRSGSRSQPKICQPKAQIGEGYLETFSFRNNTAKSARSASRVSRRGAEGDTASARAEDGFVRLATGSERNAGPQLNDPHIRVEASGTSTDADVTIRRSTVANVRIWVGIVNMIEGVIGVGPDLEFRLLGH